jgi:photosystem II stability/assembly factor-like uncharacterized protein
VNELRRDAARLEADSVKQRSEGAIAPSPGAAPVPTAPPAAAAAAQAPSALAETVAVGGATPAERLFRAAGFEIVSPDSTVRWRVAGSVVQRSTNGGSSWDTVSTGLAAQLTAGASPATAVCWLVGRGGVVLLSTDGRNWRRVAFPEATDLSAIIARDARTASVTTADGRTFNTTDAGVTWVPR